MVSSVNQQTFAQEVLGAASPVLVNFWAPWCGVCRLVDPMLHDIQVRCNQQVKLVQINADENLRLVNAYKLKTLPTVMLFNQGTILQRLETFRSREDFQLASGDLVSAVEKLLLSYSYS